MRVLITGVSGFLGQRVIRRLSGHDTLGYDIQINPEDTVLDSERMIEESVAFNPDTILHLAGPVAGMMKVKPEYWFTMQTEGTFNALNAARIVGARMVLASSFYIYEGIDPEKIVNEHTPLEPDKGSLFALSKYVAERLCQESDVESAALRFGSMYGGGGSNVVDDLLEKGHSGEPIDIWGKGERTHQFTHVDDVAAGVVLAIEAQWSGPLNLVSPEQTSTKALAALLTDTHDFRITFDESRPEGPSFPYMHSMTAIDKLEWKPRPLAEGIA